LQNLLSVWNGLDMRRRAVLALATAAVFVSVLLMSRMAATPQMSLLFAGLDSTAAGEIVSSLEGQSEPYEVRGNGIYVASDRRDALRLSLAADGLPATGGAGYELLDTLSGFGTTSQMFDAAYWRAKEGELARTIVAAPFAKSVRVHISNRSAGQPFRQGPPPSASVFVTPASDAITADQSRALAFLVASAVEGLDAANVAVIDARTGAVLSLEETVPLAEAGADRADILKARVERLLAAHVGQGRAIVEVSVETNPASEQITERRFDPDSRVAISTDTEERSSQSAGNDGAVTVASNLPDGDGAEGQGSSSQNSETRERINFEVSETQREVVLAPGAVTRITVAVLVDGLIDAATQQWRPRTEAELASLQDLVASAVGFNADRGDVITLKSLAFQPVEQLGTLAETSLMSGLTLDLTHLLQIVILALVAVTIALFVIKPLLMKPPLLTATALPPVDAADSGSAEKGRSEFEEISPSAFDLDNPTGELGSDFDFAAAGDFSLPELSGFDTANEDPVARLRNLIEERRDETVEVLRGWMDDKKEKT
jgi:flagellar M-ring protein FliF